MAEQKVVGAAAGTPGAGADQPEPWAGARSIEEADVLTPAVKKPAEESAAIEGDEEDLEETGGAPSAKPGDKPVAEKPAEKEEPPEEGDEDLDEDEESDAGEGEGEGEGAPAFDPKAFGLDESYSKCKTLGEALLLAERRRRDQELRADRQAGELGTARKRLADEEKAKTDAAAVKAAAEAAKPAGAGAAPAEWTTEQRQQVIEAWETNPESVVAWIQQPFAAAIEGFKTQVAGLESKIAELTGRVHSGEGAPYEVQAGQEWDAFAAAHPDAAELRTGGTLQRIGETLNRDVPEERQRWDYDTVYGLAKAETGNPGQFQRLVGLVRMGHSLAEASEILANAGKAGELKDAKRRDAAEQARRKKGLAGGARGPTSGQEPVTAIGIQNLA